MYVFSYDALHRPAWIRWVSRPSVFNLQYLSKDSAVVDYFDVTNFYSLHALI